ncbi:hypothetical protein ADL00_38445 [Streptomyces sp. AS58]|uniref:hypothetical protein n=1 Tax=Streptomyces sp. AS58 TaxID=1519489 RepID=UPI0006AE3C76|nr:hypothetical protein [Streptomyces sp. AS58]KOV52047.1 hypothetical protein ADL00_38445 [Streptomyces sp. AS58]
MTDIQVGDCAAAQQPAIAVLRLISMGNWAHHAGDGTGVLLVAKLRQVAARVSSGFSASEWTALSLRSE